MDLTREEYAPQVTQAHAIACGVILSLFLLFIGAWIGIAIGQYNCRQVIEARSLQPRPVCAFPTTASYIVPIHECSRVCRARWHSAKVGK